MPNLYLPWSGDVGQSINPWSWITKTVGGQFGLININLGKSSDPELEKKILDDVGTYGRQLGQIGDALAVLLDHVKLGKLEPAEEDAIKAVRLQLAQIAQIKSRHHC